MIEISVTEHVTPVFRSLLASLGARRTGAVAGRAVVNAVRQHLFTRNATHPNAQGFPRQNFWAAAARSTQSQTTSYGAVVSINQLGFRLQYQGGRVRPVNRKFLTIPAKAEAYGKRARSFPDLVFRVVPGIGPALVKAPQTDIRIGKNRKGERSVKAVQTHLGTEVFYRLVPQVVVKAHPDVLPSDEKLGEVAQGALGSYFARVIDGRGAI